MSRQRYAHSRGRRVSGSRAALCSKWYRSAARRSLPCRPLRCCSMSSRENAMSTPPLKLHRFVLSGHSHRAELALSLMRLPHALIDVDLMKGAHKTPQFLQMNPFGQVPVLDDGGTIVFDSNAILVYLGAKFDRDGRWLPREPQALAAVQGWLSAAA